FPTNVSPKLNLADWKIGDCSNAVSGTLLCLPRQAASATVGSNVVLPFLVDKIPFAFSPVATEFTVMITGTIGAVTVTGEKLDPNGSCPTITPVYVFPSLLEVTV